MEDNHTPNSGLPPTLTYEEQMLANLRPYLLDPRIDYPEPYFMFEYNGVPFSILGGIQALSGQKKNGKTFVITQLLAAALSANKSERCQAYLKGLRVPDRTLEYLGHAPKVLYVDTEMEQLNSAKVMRRVNWLCGWDLKQADDRFNVLWLRTVTDLKDSNGKVLKPSFEVRFDLIKQAIELLAPDIVLIDGIRDIIGDFNDLIQASSLVNDLMTIAQKRNICIWNVLHMNPRPGNDDESKMRGHLGTELGNKVSDTFASIKKKENNGDVTFTVKQSDARGKDVDDWKFVISDAAGNLGIPQIVDNFSPENTTKSQGSGIDQDKLKEWLHEAADHYNWPMSRAEFKSKVLNEIGGISNSDAQQRYLTAAFNLNYIEESTIKKKGAYMVQLTEELLSEMPF